MPEIKINIRTEEVFRLLEGFPRNDLERILRKLDTRFKPLKKHKIVPKYVDAHMLDRFTGMISVGGDAVKDAEGIYD